MTETAKGRVNQCSLCLSEFFAVCALPMSSDLLPFNERTIFLYLPYNEQVIVECCSGMSVLGNFIHVSLVLSSLKFIRRIFVYNFCHISISNTVCDGATKTLLLNIELA